MLMAKNGIDVFYIDESGSADLFIMTSVTIPLLRKTEDGGWRFVWEEHLDRYQEFRRNLRDTHGIRVGKELHTSKMVSGRGNYLLKGQRLGTRAAAGVYRWILRRLDQFLPESSVITVTADPDSSLYGATRLEACLHALFQRMQRTCAANDTNAMTFFDQGHGENLSIYRKAKVHLPTGSSMGGWQTGLTRNIPMSNFFKDGNFKDSKHSLFIQAADLIAYAAMLCRNEERGTLTSWQAGSNLGNAYDEIPEAVLNLSASGKDPKGMVRL